MANRINLQPSRDVCANEENFLKKKDHVLVSPSHPQQANTTLLLPSRITSRGQGPSEAVWGCCPELEKVQIHQLLPSTTGLLTELSYLQYDTPSLHTQLI